jgi:hypothetical protein
LLTDRAAHSDEHARSQPQEQVASQRGFPVLVNGSWAPAASAATSHKPTSRPVALPRPLRVPLIPCLADGFLLGRRHRAALERTDQEDSAQNGWKDLPQRSSSQWANRVWPYSITWSARPSSDGGIVSSRALAVLRLMTKSNLVGCSTGRSAGLAPRRILST